MLKCSNNATAKRLSQEFRKQHCFVDSVIMDIMYSGLTTIENEKQVQCSVAFVGVTLT